MPLSRPLDGLLVLDLRLSARTVCNSGKFWIREGDFEMRFALAMLLTAAILFRLCLPVLGKHFNCHPYGVQRWLKLKLKFIADCSPLRREFFCSLFLL